MTGQPSQAARRAPHGLTVAVVAVGLFAALPLVYLTVRTIGVGPDVLDLIFHNRTLAVFGRTVALIVAVVAGTTLIAIPAAWLTLRTDMPFRRLLTVGSVLPLVVPSYVAAYVALGVLGPRGMLQSALAPLGVERLPDIYGLPGAALVLIVISYPYVLLPVRAALMRADPALEEASRSLGYGPVKT
ncbi:MAG: iron ABC transporter permease, partial [Dehalococcoidia bacterium]